MMQMLSAGGVQCLGRYPSFEIDTTTPLDWICGIDGMAVKILDPHHYTPPFGPDYRVIWMDRDQREQAKSTIKTQRDMLGMDVHRSHLHDMQKIIKENRRPAIEALSTVSTRILMMRFERVVNHPYGAACDVADFLGLEIDTKAMANVVVKRRAACLPYMLEFQQMAAR